MAPSLEMWQNSGVAFGEGVLFLPPFVCHNPSLILHAHVCTAALPCSGIQLSFSYLSYKTSDLVCILSYAGLYDRSAVREMLKECAKMYNFNHSNVLKLKGVCLDGGTAPFIIMPFMSNGSLLAYLKNNRDKLVVSLKNNMNEEDVRLCPYSIHA